MLTKENEACARRFHMDIFQQGNLAAADELIASDFVWHAFGLPAELPRGPAGVKQVATMYRAAFPDLQIAHQDTIAAGDKVVIRWVVSGTHQSELMGVPPTGKRVTVTGIDIFRFVDGKLVEMWQNWDQLDLLQQLGAIPTPGQVAGA